MRDAKEYRRRAGVSRDNAAKGGAAADEFVNTAKMWDKLADDAEKKAAEPKSKKPKGKRR